MYYTKKELEKERWKTHQLARTMKFYTDEDLFDRFGVSSISRTLQKYQEIQDVTDCVLELYDERYQTDGYDIDEAMLRDRLQRITSHSAYQARQRASRIEKSIL
jgi:hypothetical protein